MIIGLVGKAGSGKDTFAGLMMQREHQKWNQTAFAFILKSLCRDIFSLSEEQLYGSTEAKEAVDPRWGVSAREIMQKMGTEVGRQGRFDTFGTGLLEHRIRHAFEEAGLVPHENLWVDSTIQHMTLSRGTHWLVTDCRFLNEAEALRNNSGIIVRIRRPADSSSEAYAGHESETEQDRIQADSEILNYGTLDDLRRGVEVFAKLRNLGILPEELDTRSPPSVC